MVKTARTPTTEDVGDAFQVTWLFERYSKRVEDLFKNFEDEEVFETGLLLDKDLANLDWRIISKALEVDPINPLTFNKMVFRAMARKHYVDAHAKVVKLYDVRYMPARYIADLYWHLFKCGYGVAYEITHKDGPLDEEDEE